MLANSEPLIKEITYVTRKTGRSKLPMFKIYLHQESETFVTKLQSVMAFNIEALGSYLFTLFGNSTYKDDPTGEEIKKIQSILIDLWNEFNSDIPLPEILTKSKLFSYIPNYRRN